MLFIIIEWLMVAWFMSVNISYYDKNAVELAKQYDSLHLSQCTVHGNSIGQEKARMFWMLVQVLVGMFSGFVIKAALLLLLNLPVISAN
ncbi:hypothetical protein P4S64_02535 [Vibrio sp. M60_M31a]